MKVAINGFGRIGKQFFLAAIEAGVKWDFIINELSELDSIVYGLRYDSVHPAPKEKISCEKGYLHFGNRKIKVISQPNAELLPWKDEKVDLVVDFTGVFTARKDAEKHLKAGAKKVLISAPAKEHDCTIVFGINNKALKKEHKIVSAGSCTTNCAAPMLKVLNDKYGVDSAHFVTVHAMTATQKIIDSYGKKDFRGGRAASENIIPSTSGASISVVEALPELKGKLEGYSLRVPVIDGSITSLTVNLKKQASVEQINKAFMSSSMGELKGILDFKDESLVSTDIIHNPFSCIFDSQLTKVAGNSACVAGWYDNEWGYSNRLVDVAELMLNYLLN